MLIKRAVRVVVNAVLCQRSQMSLDTELLTDARLVTRGSKAGSRRLAHLMAHLTDRLSSGCSGGLREDLARRQARGTLRIDSVELLLAVGALGSSLVRNFDALQKVLVQSRIVAASVSVALASLIARIVLVLEALRRVLRVLERRA